jgi:hypothetical protein
MHLVAKHGCQEYQVEHQTHHVAVPSCQACRVEQQGMHPVATPSCQEYQVEDSRIHPVAIPGCQKLPLLPKFQTQLRDPVAKKWIGQPCCHTLLPKTTPVARPRLPTLFGNWATQLPQFFLGNPVALPSCDLSFLIRPSCATPVAFINIYTNPVAGPCCQTINLLYPVA